MSTIDLVTAIGEFAIAIVIVWEMEENRRDRFLTEAAKIKNYADRGRIYAAFHATPRETVEAKSREFCKRIRLSGGDAPKLKLSCERQIVLFGRLAQIKRRALFYRRDYVKLFPHAVVLFWIMVNPYVKERREMTGEWWASDFESLARDCLEFLLREKSDVKLIIYGSDRQSQRDFVIAHDYLTELRSQLRSKSRDARTPIAS
jgi:hypothetical protein